MSENMEDGTLSFSVFPTIYTEVRLLLPNISYANPDLADYNFGKRGYGVDYSIP